MATANFPAVNTSKIYAFGFDVYIDEETIKYNNLDYKLMCEFAEETTRFKYDIMRAHATKMLYKKGWEYDNDYNAIAKKTIPLTFAGVNMEISVSARVYSGYYEGAVFDVEPTIKVITFSGAMSCAYDLDEIKNNVIVDDDWCGNVGMSKIQAANIERKILAAVQTLIGEAESVFQLCSERRLACVGHFDNGSALYVDLESQSV